jgi:quinol monooxygenase YgiN
MFVRIVECQARPGRREQVSNQVKTTVLPILQEQAGFVDFVALADRSDAERLLCVSFWTSQEDAAHYHQQHYETIANLLAPVLEGPPTLETFAVNASTSHRLAIDRAA